MSSTTGFLPAFMMFMSVGMRGSLISLTTVAAAGSGLSRVSTFSPMLRSARRTAPAISSERA